jgi:hypothetical protein
MYGTVPITTPSRVCSAEIEHLHAAIGGHHHVGGLEVPVDDAFSMRGRERIRDGRRNGEQTIDREAALRNHAVERLALDQLHREEVDAVGLFDRMERHDVRMIERGGGPRLSLETFEALRIAAHVGRQDLEGHRASEPGVRGAVDLTHAAGANRGGNPVVSEGLANHGWPGL